MTRSVNWLSAFKARRGKKESIKNNQMKRTAAKKAAVLFSGAVLFGGPVGYCRKACEKFIGSFHKF
jgi:hypothetical protein